MQWPNEKDKMTNNDLKNTAQKTNVRMSKCSKFYAIP